MGVAGSLLVDGVADICVNGVVDAKIIGECVVEDGSSGICRCCRQPRSAPFASHCLRESFT